MRLAFVRTGRARPESQLTDCMPPPQAGAEPRKGAKRPAAVRPAAPAPPRSLPAGPAAGRACPNFAHGQKALESAFLEHLLAKFDITRDFFAVQHDRCYCVRCYPSSFPDVLGQEGTARYIVPRGWYRFGVHLRPGVAAQNKIFEEWLVSYHGLQALALKSWLMQGAAIPGDRLVDGTVLGSTNCAGRQDRCYYTSPTIKYAGLGFYARPTEFVVDGQMMVGQVRDRGAADGSEVSAGGRDCCHERAMSHARAGRRWCSSAGRRRAASSDRGRP